MIRKPALSLSSSAIGSEALHVSAQIDVAGGALPGSIVVVTRSPIAPMAACHRNQADENLGSTRPVREAWPRRGSPPPCPTRAGTGLPWRTGYGISSQWVAHAWAGPRSCKRPTPNCITAP